MRWLLTVFLLLAGCGSPLGPAANAVNTRYTDEVLSSVVGLVNDAGRPYCTGVLWQGYVITALHCVEGKDEVHVGFRGDEFGNTFLRSFAFEEKISDPDEDLAILARMSDVPLYPYRRLAPNGPHRGQYVMIVGHPYRRAYTSAPGHVTNPYQSWGFVPNHWFITNVQHGPGFSGSPVFNRHGEILGIHSFSLGASGRARLPGHIHLQALRVLTARLANGDQ